MTGASSASKEASMTSREETTKLLMGEEENLIDNMVKGEQNTLLFELNLNIRNKILDGYNEIMRTQV